MEGYSASYLYVVRSCWLAVIRVNGDVTRYYDYTTAQDKVIVLDNVPFL